MYTTYQSTYFIDGFTQGVIKNPKINEIQQVHQKICTEQVSSLKITCCYIILHLNLKRLRFTGESMTQQTRQSHANVIHVIHVKEFIMTSRHVMPRRIISRFTLQP